MTAASQSEIAGAPAAPAAAPCVSAKETLAAFERTQTERWRCTDLLASLLMPLLTLLVATGPPAAVAASCLTLALPGALALLAPHRWFARRRNWVVAGCRLASMLLLERAVPPSAPAAPEWPGGLKLLALSRTLSLNLFAWGNRLPLRVSHAGWWFVSHPDNAAGRALPMQLACAMPARLLARQGSLALRSSSPALPAAPPSWQWLVWVQLAGTLQSARICFQHICPSPAFSGPAAQAPLRRMATAAGALRVLLPTPGPLADGGELCAGAVP